MKGRGWEIQVSKGHKQSFWKAVDLIHSQRNRVYVEVYMQEMYWESVPLGNPLRKMSGQRELLSCDVVANGLSFRSRGAEMAIQSWLELGQGSQAFAVSTIHQSLSVSFLWAVMWPWARGTQLRALSYQEYPQLEERVSQSSSMELLWDHSIHHRYEFSWSWCLWVGFVWLEKGERDLSVGRRHKIGCFFFPPKWENIVALS